VKEIKMTKIPKCDFCGKPALYDAPTRNGPWGYMCSGCYADHGTKGGLGSKLVVSKGLNISEEDKKKKKKTVMPTMEDMEMAVMDGVWYPKCPYCGCENGCEPDGESVFCDDCGEHYEVGNCC